MADETNDTSAADTGEKPQNFTEWVNGLSEDQLKQVKGTVDAAATAKRPPKFGSMTEQELTRWKDDNL